MPQSAAAAVVEVTQSDLEFCEDYMYTKDWRVQRHTPDLEPPSRAVDDATVQGINHGMLRLIVAMAQFVMGHMAGDIKDALPSLIRRPGHPRYHPLVAFLAAELLFLLILTANQRLASRRDRARWLATEDGREAPLPLLPRRRRGPCVKRGRRRPRYPTPIARALGFNAGVPLSEDQLQEAEGIFAAHFDSIVKHMMVFLRGRAKAILPDYGTHLVADGTYFASPSHDEYGAWHREGYPRKNPLLWERRKSRVPLDRLGVLAAPGACHKSFRWKLPPLDDDEQQESSAAGDGKPRKGRNRKKYEPMFFGRRVLLVLDGPSGLPVIVVIVPADKQERDIFIEHVIPELRGLKRDRVISPKTLAADAGFSGNRISMALHRLGIDPRIDLVDRTERWQDDQIQGGRVRISLLVRGHLARRIGHVRRTHDRYGRPLKRPKLVPLWHRLPIRRIDVDRNRVGYGCARVPARLVRLLSVETDRINATTYFPCGAKHMPEDPCRADVNGVLYWVTNTGPDLDTTVVTRARPADGNGFRLNEIVHAEIGPRASERKRHDSRGGLRIGVRRDLAGIYRTPLSPRDHPNVRSDFRRVRACIERKNGVLRRYTSLTVACGWKETAAWQGFLSVLSIFALALSNMERLEQRDRARRLSAQRRFCRLCLIAGYIVERVRARQKRVQPLSGAPPPMAV